MSVRKCIVFGAMISTVACAVDNGMQPDASSDGKRPVFTSLALAPESVTVAEGYQLQLSASALNQYGLPMILDPKASYVTDAPAVVTVAPTGFITTNRPGLARITATATIEGITKTADSFVKVTAGVPVDTLLLQPSPLGWMPIVGYLKAGGLVIWTGESAEPMIHLIDFESGGIVDTFAPTNGIAAKRFSVPGRFLFCSVPCERRSDWGQFYIK